MAQFDSNGGCVNAFQKNLRFFQNQVDQTQTLFAPKAIQETNIHRSVLKTDNNTSRTITSSPTVDSVLRSVKNIYLNRSAQKEEKSYSTVPSSGSNDKKYENESDFDSHHFVVHHRLRPREYDRNDQQNLSHQQHQRDQKETSDQHYRNNLKDTKHYQIDRDDLSDENEDHAPRDVHALSGQPDPLVQYPRYDWREPSDQHDRSGRYYRNETSDKLYQDVNKQNSEDRHGQQYRYDNLVQSDQYLHDREDPGDQHLHDRGDQGDQHLLHDTEDASDMHYHPEEEDPDDQHYLHNLEDPGDQHDLSDQHEPDEYRVYANNVRAQLQRPSLADEMELEAIPEEDEDDLIDYELYGRPYQPVVSRLQAEEIQSERPGERRGTGGATWDPKKLLDALYKLDYNFQPLKKHMIYTNKEGYLETLPSGRKKATYWNSWKKKYFKLKDGIMYCYDSISSEKPSSVYQLMGGRLDCLDNGMFGIDDQKGRYVVVRCPAEGGASEAAEWAESLSSQLQEEWSRTFATPCPRSLPARKGVLVIDLGSCSVRAGVLMSSPSLPQLFFPTVCATLNKSNRHRFGFDALHPEIRKESVLQFPLHETSKANKLCIDLSVLPALLRHIFLELNVSPDNYKVQMSMPRNIRLATKVKIAKILFDDFSVRGANLTHQAILSFHAYNTKSGIIVDLGERLDVIPIIEGYILESGVTRLPYGGQRMLHHFKHVLAEKGISLCSAVDGYLARHVMEQSCRVAEDAASADCPPHTTHTVPTASFFEPGHTQPGEVEVGAGRFQVPEGLFAPGRWGLDAPGLAAAVARAIQAAPVDARRELARTICLSGGLSLLHGLPARLEHELRILLPRLQPQVHASPHRYHMSYIGACQVALEQTFEDICITNQIWKKEGSECIKKWA